MREYLIEDEELVVSKLKVSSILAKCISGRGVSGKASKPKATKITSLSPVDLEDAICIQYNQLLTQRILY